MGEQRIFVSTRKGLFQMVRSADWWEIERVSFLGDAVSLSLYDARDGSLYAALGLGHFGVKLRRSRDLGVTWDELPAPAFPKPPEGQVDTLPDGKPWPWRVEQIWALEAGAAARRALVRDHRRGALPLARLGLVVAARARTVGAPEAQGVVRRRRRSPGHPLGVRRPEGPSRSSRSACRAAASWRSEDGGETWGLSARGMFAEYMPPQRRDDEAIQDPHRIVQCGARPQRLWCQHHNGVFRSDDGGRSWVGIPDVRPAVFGFAVAVHPEDGDTAWLVPATKDEKRVPVDARVVVARTRDAGQDVDRAHARPPADPRLRPRLSPRALHRRDRAAHWPSAARRARSGRRMTAATPGPACPTTCRPSTPCASRNSLRGDADRPQHNLCTEGPIRSLGAQACTKGDVTGTSEGLSSAP